MTQVSGVTNGASGDDFTQNDALRGLDMEHFLKLMIAELQNQDPLDPMDNNQILAQISQIREVGATETLTQTLEAVMLGQNLSTASGMIGKHVRALQDNGDWVEGIVDRVSVADGKSEVHIGEAKVRLANIAEIRDAGGEESGPDETGGDSEGT